MKRNEDLANKLLGIVERFIVNTYIDLEDGVGKTVENKQLYTVNKRHTPTELNLLYDTIDTLESNWFSHNSLMFRYVVGFRKNYDYSSKKFINRISNMDESKQAKLNSFISKNQNAKYGENWSNAHVELMHWLINTAAVLHTVALNNKSYNPEAKADVKEILSEILNIIKNLEQGNILTNLESEITQVIGKIEKNINDNPWLTRRWDGNLALWGFTVAGMALGISFIIAAIFTGGAVFPFSLGLFLGFTLLSVASPSILSLPGILISNYLLTPRKFIFERLESAKALLKKGVEAAKVIKNINQIDSSQAAAPATLDRRQQTLCFRANTSANVTLLAPRDLDAVPHSINTRPRSRKF